MTEQQEKLNNQIKELPIIADLATGQQEIMKSVATLSSEFQKESEHHETEFKKGEAKFAKLEDKIADLEDTMNTALKEVSSNLHGLKTELKDERIEKMAKQLDDKNTIRNGIIITVFTVILTAIFSNIPPITLG